MALPIRATLTLIAKEAETGNLGIVTASRLTAGGAFIPFLNGGIGAVATQNLPEPRIASVMLEDLSAGVDPQAALERALRFFGWADQRQVGLVVALPQDGQLPALAFTGQNCLPWCGHRVHNDLVVLGNGLTGENVLITAESAFLGSPSPHLAERLIEGLLAGEVADCPDAALPGLREEGFQDMPRALTESGSMADFDKEMAQASRSPDQEHPEKPLPKCSASIKVVGGQAFQTPLLDLRVDDHERAANELHRVWILFQRMNA